MTKCLHGPSVWGPEQDQSNSAAGRIRPALQATNDHISIQAYKDTC